MTSDKTSEILESLDNFIEKRIIEIEEENKLLLEKAKKEFEEIITAQKNQPLLRPRPPERKNWSSQRADLKLHLVALKSWILSSWLKVISFIRQGGYFLVRRFKRKR